MELQRLKPRVIAGTATAFWTVAGAALVVGLSLARTSYAHPPYEPIEYTESDRTITLAGNDMTLEDVVLIALHGARIELSDEARQRAADAYGLLLQGAAEGIPIYWFNRGAGSEREVWMFQGSPMEPENKKYLEEQQLARFRGAGLGGYPPEIEEEALVRAMMAIRSNTMTYEAASPGLTQMLLDLLNHRITPVVKARGSLGEGDLGIVAQLGAAMVGAGEVYYRGERMPAARALERAGLSPLKPFGADDAALISTNVYAIAQTALLLDEARQLLNWNDLSYAMAVNGMNSSLTPISMPVQSNRPYPWLNWNAARIMDMVSGSYLFEADPDRIIQDPISMRASTQRAGSAWQAWARLRDTTLIAMNSSDHNPAVRPGLTPDDSPELSTSQFMQYYIKGGELSNGKSGYILSNANWDPYPMANDIEFFTIGLANLYVAVTQRIERFSNPFFTVIEDPTRFTPGVGGYLPVALWQQLMGHINPVAPQGQPIVATVEDLEAQTWLKVTRAREAVDVGMHLTAQDLQTAAHWMEIRKEQDPSRSFGKAPTDALAALRAAVPTDQRAGRPDQPVGVLTYEFMRETPATTFYPAGPPQP
jgi:histidine ammonia-lyase